MMCLSNLAIVGAGLATQMRLLLAMFSDLLVTFVQDVVLRLGESLPPIINRVGDIWRGSHLTASLGT